MTLTLSASTYRQRQWSASACAVRAAKFNPGTHWSAQCRGHRAQLPRGLVLIIGAAGSGKSTTMASLVDHRAHHHPGHILTVEDPIEYFVSPWPVHRRPAPRWADTTAFPTPPHNAMRQAPGHDHHWRNPRPRNHAACVGLRGDGPPMPCQRCTPATPVRRSSASLNFFPESAIRAIAHGFVAQSAKPWSPSAWCPAISGGRALATEGLLASAHVG